MPQQQSRTEQEKAACAHQKADVVFERFLDLLGRLIARVTLDRNTTSASSANEIVPDDLATKVKCGTRHITPRRRLDTPAAVIVLLHSTTNCLRVSS